MYSHWRPFYLFFYSFSFLCLFIYSHIHPRPRFLTNWITGAIPCKKLSSIAKNECRHSTGIGERCCCSPPLICIAHPMVLLSHPPHPYAQPRPSAWDLPLESKFRWQNSSQLACTWIPFVCKTVLEWQVFGTSPELQHRASARLF